MEHRSTALGMLRMKRLKPYIDRYEYREAIGGEGAHAPITPKRSREAQPS